MYSRVAVRLVHTKRLSPGRYITMYTGIYTLQHMCQLGLARTEDCLCQAEPQSPGHVLQFCPLFREARQDQSPQGTFYSSAPSSEKQDRTTVPRARSTVLPPLQRSKTGPQAPGHVLQFCPLFREARQDHSHQGTFYSSARSSEKQERSSAPRSNAARQT